jgi:hypothetical protein
VILPLKIASLFSSRAPHAQTERAREKESEREREREKKGVMRELAEKKLVHFITTITKPST